MKFRLRDWFKWTFYIGFALTIFLHGKVFLDYDAETQYNRFKFRIWNTNIVELSTQRVFKYIRPTGYNMKLEFADREVIDYTWSYKREN